MTRCAQCLLRSGTAGIFLDAQGVCNVCNVWSKCASGFICFDKLEQQFKDIIGRVYSKHAYDAVVGLSGGKDSVFVLHRLVQYGLKILAAVIDLGFMPNATASANITNAIRETGVDTVRLTVPREVIKKLFNTWLSMFCVLTPCHACGRILETQLLKCAIENDAPLIVTGFDRAQLLGKLHLLSRRLRAYNGIQYTKKETIFAEAISNFNWLEHMCFISGVKDEQRYSLLPRYELKHRSSFIPRFLHYFLFHPYNEVDIKKEISDAGLWTLPPNDDLRRHHDCDVKTAAAYGAYAIGAGERLEFELSFDIREGRITRDSAMKRLYSEHAELNNTFHPYSSYSEAFNLQEHAILHKVSILRMITPIHTFISNNILRCLGSGRLSEDIIRIIRAH